MTIEEALASLGLFQVPNTATAKDVMDALRYRPHHTWQHVEATEQSEDGTELGPQSAAA